MTRLSRSGLISLVLCLSLFAQVATVQGMGNIQGYRLREPPCFEWYCRILPYRWWNQIEVYDSFVECERSKQAIISQAKEDAKPREVPLPDGTMAKVRRVEDTRLYVECEAVR